MIAAGKLLQRIGIQELKYKEINGSRVGDNWTDVYKCPAYVKRINDNRVFELGKISQNSAFEITIRSQPELPFIYNGSDSSKKYRLIEYKNDEEIKRVFTIHTIDDDNDVYKIVAFQVK